MRLRKLSPALAAAASLLALAPVAASAAPRHAGPRPHRNGAISGCSLSLLAQPPVVASGQPAQLVGQLSCPGNPSAAVGATVTVYEHQGGIHGFTTLGAATTGAGGFYSVEAKALSTNAVFYARSGDVRSVARQIKVAPTVTLEGPKETKQIFTGRAHSQIFTGTVSPENKGALVVLQRESATSFEEWHSIQRGIVGEHGKFEINHTFVAPGEADLRVVVRPLTPFTIRGASNTLSYTVSQTENPRLTLTATTDPISLGQSLTLEGTLKGAVKQPVILYSHVEHASFTVVAKATTDESGKYSFPVAPTQNTAYKVTGGGISSAVLFEGVKNVLTATVSGTSVPSGQPLTFSGTVKPADVGHSVYIERQNIYTGGFQVVDTGFVKPGLSPTEGAFSIEDGIFGVGKAVFRVKIPGDTVNEAATSQTFTIEVIPPVPGPPREFAPNRLPSEGQL